MIFKRKVRLPPGDPTPTKSLKNDPFPPRLQNAQPPYFFQLDHLCSHGNKDNRLHAVFPFLLFSVSKVQRTERDINRILLYRNIAYRPTISPAKNTIGKDIIRRTKKGRLLKSFTQLLVLSTAVVGLRWISERKIAARYAKNRHIFGRIILIVGAGQERWEKVLFMPRKANNDELFCGLRRI